MHVVMTSVCFPLFPALLHHNIVVLSYNTNNNLIYKAPVCRGTSVALADSSNCVH